MAKLLQYDSLTDAPNLQPERTTVDKWYVETSRPRWDTKRQQFYDPYAPILQEPTNHIAVASPLTNTITYTKQFQYQVWTHPIARMSDPERTTPDKWIGYKPDYINKVKNTNHLYPPFLIDPYQLTQLERTTPDKWQSDTEVPLFDKKRNQYTYPYSWFYPYPQTAAAETITLDKWLGYEPDRFFRDAPRYYSPSFTPFLEPLNNVFVPSLANINITFSKQVQYQMVAKPLYFASETIAPDKWAGYEPDYINKQKNFNHLMQFFDIDRYQLTQPERVSADRWIGCKPDKIFDTKRQQYTYPHLAIDPYNLTQGERITPDKWCGYYPDKIFDLKKQQYMYPSAESRALPPSLFEVVTMDKWEGFEPDKLFDLKRNQYGYPYAWLDPYPQAAPAETITIDKWLGNHPDLLFRLKYQQFVPTINPFQIVTTSNVVFSGQSVVVVFKRRFQYQGMLLPILGIGQTEGITPDKWQGFEPDKIFDIKRNQFMYPTFNIDASHLRDSENITVDKWFRETEKPRFDLKRMQFVYPTQAFRTETVSINTLPFGEFSVLPDMVFRDKFRPYYYPAFFIDAKQLTQAEIIRLDKWYAETQRPRWDIRRQQFIYPSQDIRNQNNFEPTIDPCTYYIYHPNPTLPLFHPYYYPAFMQRFIGVPDCEDGWYTRNNTLYTSNNSIDWKTDNKTDFSSDNTPSWSSENKTKWKEEGC